MTPENSSNREAQKVAWEAARAAEDKALVEGIINNPDAPAEKLVRSAEIQAKLAEAKAEADRQLADARAKIELVGEVDPKKIAASEEWLNPWEGEDRKAA